MYHLCHLAATNLCLKYSHPTASLNTSNELPGDLYFSSKYQAVFSYSSSNSRSVSYPKISAQCLRILYTYSNKMNRWKNGVKTELINSKNRLMFYNGSYPVLLNKINSRDESLTPRSHCKFSPLTATYFLLNKFQEFGVKSR